MMQRFILVVLVCLLAVVGLDAQGKGKGRAKKQPRPAPTAPTGWWLEGYRPPVLTNVDGHPSFVFGTSWKSTANKLTEPFGGAQPGATLTFTVRRTNVGTPVFISADTSANACSTPATGRAYIERNDWTNGGLPDHQWARWWSRVAFVVLSQTGDIVVTTAFDPALWSNVNGRLANSSPEAVAGFEHAVLVGGRRGFTFGSGCFYGHGLYTSGGSASFTVLDYSIL